MKKERKEKQQKIPISQILLRIQLEEKKESITYAELFARLGDHAFGLIIILFALPSVLPLSIIPGFSFFFSLPIIMIALYLIIGKQTLWIPQFLAVKEINLSQLDKVIQKTVPYLIKIERILKPRWLFLTTRGMERLHGVLLLLLGILLTLPIPMSNFFLATLIILIGMGLTEKDGVMIALAYCGAFAVFFVFKQLIYTFLCLVFNYCLS